MAKSRENEDIYERRLSPSRKPYNADNSFVKKVATKVTELMPPKSWISKWFNTSQDIGDSEVHTKIAEKYTEIDDETDQAPPLKRPRIRMDTVHPPGTFSIQSRKKSYDSNRYKFNNSVKNANNYKQDFSSFASKQIDDTLEPSIAGPSGSRPLVTSTPAVPLEYRSQNNQHRSKLNTLVSTQNNGAANGMDDNSESSESTSGCSSLIPQTNRQEEPSAISYDSTFSSKRKLSESLLEYNNFVGNYSNQSRRTLFLNSNRETVGSRQPSFNASVMNNSVDKNSTLVSPFYSGNTIFGGASAANLFKQGRNLFNSSTELQLKVPKRVTVQVQPSNNTNETATMSQTTKRILETLENFSSLVTDAKKIPVKRRSEIYSPATARRRIRDDESNFSTRVGLRHLSRELVVPTVADMLKIKRRQKLQDSTIAARKIMSANSTPPSKGYQIRNEAADKHEFQGKLKSGRRGKNNLEEEETVEAVNLPSIALPISTLPRFDIAVPQNQKSSSTKLTSDNSKAFTFASPIRMSNVPNTFSPVNSFTFSKPLTVDDKEADADNSLESSKTFILDTQKSIPNFTFSSAPSSLTLKSKIDSGYEEMKTESVAEFFEKNSAETSVANSKKNTEEKVENLGKLWECQDCYIRNNDKDEKCIACRAKKPAAKTEKVVNPPMEIKQQLSSTTSGFGVEFKLQASQWECECCMVRNNQLDKKCVSCSTPKPSAKIETKNVPSNLMNKFKPAEGSWECPTCMIRNPEVTSICPCCTTPKPGSNTAVDVKKDEIVKVENKNESSTWECPCCMVRNKASASVCPCCEAPNPVKSKAKKSSSTFDSSISAKLEETDKPKTNEKVESKLKFNCDMPGTNTFKFGFDKSNKSAESTTNTVSKSSETNSFSFGMPKSDKTFTFGINQNNKPEGLTTNTALPSVSKSVETKSFSFGIPKSSETEVSKPSSNFSFGTSTNATSIKAPTSESKNEVEKKVEETTEKAKGTLPKSTASFSFGVPSAKTDKPTEPAFSFGASTNKETISTAGFSFGAKTNCADAEKSKSAETKPSFDSSAKSESHTDDNTTIKSNDGSATSNVKPVFTFGNKPNLSITSTTSLTTSSTASTILHSFTFPDQPKSSSLPSFKSGLSTATTNVSSEFSFGSTKTPETAQTPQEAKPLSFSASSSSPATTLSLGNSSTPSLFNSTEVNNPTLSFGFDDKKTATSPPMFGSFEQKAQNLFAASTNASAKTTTTGSIFSDANKTSTPSFGSTASTFGSTTTPNFFSASQTEPSSTASTATPSLFTFGSGSSQSTQSPSTGFTFPVTNPVTPAVQKPLFTFSAGGTSSPAQQPQQPPQNSTSFSGFGGGVTASQPAIPAPSTSFTFGATPKSETIATPVFGQTAAPTASMFNAPQQPGQTPSFPATNTGFGFGATNAPAPSSGFNYNPGQTPAASSTGGFNFNAPSSSTVAFDPNTRPSFNFTGGGAPPTFNATPVPPSSSGNFRRIKKAVRRMTPR